MSVGGRSSALSPEAFDWIAAALQGEPQALGFSGQLSTFSADALERPTSRRRCICALDSIAEATLY
jgi:hypothetical protein